jgi:hypothetical protein
LAALVCSSNSDDRGRRLGVRLEEPSCRVVGRTDVHWGADASSFGVLVSRYRQSRGHNCGTGIIASGGRRCKH